MANGGASLWGSGGYSYDAMGNMLTASLGTARNATFSYDGTTPKIALATDNGNVVAPQYDGAGNELTGTSDTIGRRETRVYSARNLLARIDAEQSGRSERYTFDGRGVRVLWKEFTGSTQTASRSYVYAPELNLLSQKDATAAALDILWFAGAPIAQQQGTGTLRFTFTDHLGTPVLQTDNGKRPSVLWRAEYEPYGNIFAMRAGTRTDQPLRFPGQEYAWPSASGAEENYNIFRWYRSASGAYTQPDPVGIALGGSYHGVNNLYSYAKSNPIANLDPRGLLATENCLGHEKKEVEDAARSLEKQGWGSCKLCDLGLKNKQIGNKLRNTTVHCVDYYQQSDYGISSADCGGAYKPSGAPPYTLTFTGSDLYVTKAGREGGCGCLERTLFHEVLHLALGQNSGEEPVHSKIHEVDKCISCGR